MLQTVNTGVYSYYNEKQFATMQKCIMIEESSLDVIQLIFRNPCMPPKEYPFIAQSGRITSNGSLDFTAWVTNLEMLLDLQPNDNIKIHY
jgi:hypothetical protein